MLLRNILTFFVVVVLLSGYAAYDGYRFLTTPGSEESRELVFTIEPGATFDRVAWDLKKAGAITDVFRFRLLGQYRKALGGIRAGEYALQTGWLPEQILYRITRGQALLHRLSIREGLTWWETGRVLEAQGFARYEDFRNVIHDAGFLRANNIPFANAEGFLYPETYLLKKPKALDAASAEEVASLLVRMFWKQTEPLWMRLPVKAGGKGIDRELPALREVLPVERNAPGDSPQPVAGDSGPLTADAGASPPMTEAVGNATVGGSAITGANATLPAETPRNNATFPSARRVFGPATPADVDPDALKRMIILASLVERETPVPGERPRVAGVYANRLRLGMLLQCDPTVMYGVGEAFSGEIRRSQLQDASNLYNTYQHAGLPPGPICSPGVDAMAAAFMPEKHQYLYFVVSGSGGGHTFSKTLADHNKAVEAYRRAVRAR